MKVSYSYLNDVAFLKELAKQHVKTYYVKISVLNWKEQPVTSIEGRWPEFFKENGQLKHCNRRYNELDN